MKLFWKIFATVLISFMIVILLAAYTVTIKRMAEMENHIVEENKIFCDFISKQIEVGYLEAKWPFESLRKISEQEDFIFWWIVRDDGIIHLADNAEFMETSAYGYFPEITGPTGESAFLNRNKNYGILVKPIETGKDKWSFWLGFSLKSISDMEKDVMRLAMISSLVLVVMLGIILYLTVTLYTRPIRKLTEAAKRIKEGDLDHEVKIKSKDEAGELAKTFNEMRLGLKDRNDLLDSLLSAFKGKFGNLATILVRKNIEDMVRKNPRIRNILPKVLGTTVAKAEKLQKSKKT
jgi:HAMP domain-containing protein